MGMRGKWKHDLVENYQQFIEKLASNIHQRTLSFIFAM